MLAITPNIVSTIEEFRSLTPDIIIDDNAVIAAIKDEAIDAAFSINSNLFNDLKENKEIYQLARFREQMQIISKSCENIIIKESKNTIWNEFLNYIENKKNLIDQESDYVNDCAKDIFSGKSWLTVPTVFIKINLTRVFGLLR